MSSFAGLTQYTNATDRQTNRQTERQTEHGTVTSIPIGEIAFSDVDVA